jgi:hypothetical protein
MEYRTVQNAQVREMVQALTRRLQKEE